MEPAQIPWFPAWGIDFFQPVEDSKRLLKHGWKSELQKDG